MEKPEIGCVWWKHANWHYKLRLNSVKLNVLGRSPFEPIQMPVCMELGSSVHLEALGSMINLRKQFNTEVPRAFPNCMYATQGCIWVEYSAKLYELFTLGCIAFVELFRVRYCHKTEQPTCVFKKSPPPSALQFGSFVHDTTPRWLLVAYRRCLWPLDAYSEVTLQFQKM
jgi:hypothetical protein